MTTSQQSSRTNQANPALLHRFLGIGLVILAVAMVIVRHAGGLEAAQEGTLLPAYITSGVSFLMCVAALMFLKPLVPRRGAGKPLAAVLGSTPRWRRRHSASGSSSRAPV